MTYIYIQIVQNVLIVQNRGFDMTTLSITEARKNLPDILNKVHYAGENFMVEKHGKKIAAVISIQDFQLYEHILENLENEIDIKEAKKALAEAKEVGTIALDTIKEKFNL